MLNGNFVCISKESIEEEDVSDEESVPTCSSDEWLNNLDMVLDDSSGSEDGDFSRPLTEEDDDECMENEEEDQLVITPTMDKQSENLLCIPLSSVYEEDSLSFASLFQPDLLVSQLFQSVSFVEVHLAIVAQSDAETFWIHKWIASSHCIPHSTQFKFKLEDNLVGKFGPLSGLGSSCNIANYRPALIIQPRNQSVFLGCRYNFDDVLSHLRYLAQNSGDEPYTRSVLIATLRQVLQFCLLEPYPVWNVQSFLVGDRARHLMNLCTNLGAKKEGLELLSLLGSDYELEPRHKVLFSHCEDQPLKQFYEGVRNKQVADAIANFECHVSGKQYYTNITL